MDSYERWPDKIKIKIEIDMNIDRNISNCGDICRLFVLSGYPIS